ncbi:hypothetical protein WP12_04750 [Sphingomonas sp. SRS2]|nr:hypothetical protein WP12_04750 [Sphingomonas sp. SRS2]
MASENMRWISAWLGVMLWLSYPFIFYRTSKVELEYIILKNPDFFNDHLPILEFLFIPAFVLTFAYLFARFAFTIYAPPADERSGKWSLAATSSGDEAFPVVQIAAVLGASWSVYQLSHLPPLAAYWYLPVYWVAWILWFITAAAVSWPSKDSGD